MQRAGASCIWMEIELRRDGGNVWVSARSSRGEQTAPHALGPDLTAGLIDFTARAREAAARRRPVDCELFADGRRLAGAMLREETGKLFERLTEAVRSEGAGGPLLVRLLPHDAELKAVPWEALATS